MPTCDECAAPTTKHVTGHGVQPTSDVNILWSCGAVFEPPVINRFVPLLPLAVVSSCLDVTLGRTDSEHSDIDIATPIVDMHAADSDGPDSDEDKAEQHQPFVRNELSGLY